MNFFKKLFGKKEKVVEIPSVVFEKHDVSKLSPIDNQLNYNGRLNMLIDYAMEHKVGIVVGKQERADFISLVDDSIRIFRLANGFTFEIKNVDYAEVLVDETVSREMFKWLKEQPNISIRGGFIGEE